ncbi:MAG: Hint domain-containing protein [Sedimentitalea sp.]
MARISELHYSNAYAASSGVAEFLEVSLGPADDPADFTVSFYQHTGLVGFELGLNDPGITVTVDPENGEINYVISADVFPIYLTDPNGGGSTNYEAYALTDTSGLPGTVIDFYDIGGGTQNILAQDGVAAGAVSENLPVLVGPDSTTTTLQFNQPNPDTLTHSALTPGDTGLACFVAGTLIDTPDGMRAIQTLKPGDMVNTRDDGAQTVRWIGTRTVPGQGQFAPICIDTGVMGATQPVWVSPQHRILVTGWQSELFFATPEVLIAAKALVNGTTIRRRPVAWVCYVHIMFDGHQIVSTQGLDSESFYPGAQAMTGATGREVLALFPNLSGYGPLARPEPEGDAARLLCVA